MLDGMLGGGGGGLLGSDGLDMWSSADSSGSVVMTMTTTTMHDADRGLLLPSLADPSPFAVAPLGAASVASFWPAVVTEIHLCTVCSCQEILRRSGRG
jgi:hypothetical protein